MANDIKSFLLRVPHSLYKRLKNEGKKQNRSINNLCTSLLSLALEGGSYGGQPRNISISGDLFAKLDAYIRAEVLPSFSSSLVGVVLFGSVARGEIRDSSDIDLLVVLKSDASLDRDSYSKLSSVRINGHIISPLIVQFSTAELPVRSIWLEVAIEGCVLLDTDFSISRLLTKIRHHIVSGSIKRSMAYGVPYWIQQESEAKEVQ